jgi:hypothetical protein
LFAEQPSSEEWHIATRSIFEVVNDLFIRINVQAALEHVNLDQSDL